jgi:acetylglutamate kinase
VFQPDDEFARNHRAALSKKDIVLSTLVLKISGHELDDNAYLASLAAIVVELRAQQHQIVIVHGGGKEISALQTRLGIEPRYVDGIRVTDAESLALVEMVLCGAVNKRLTGLLVNAGIDALGLSGVDRGLVRGRKLHIEGHDMGFTGDVTAVRVQVIHEVLASQIVPVIAPICLGEDSHLNVNADKVAGAIAGALDADKLIFLSNVPGVMADGEILPQLREDEVNRLIGTGVIFGGMIPKVQTALKALEDGVQQAVITNLSGLQHGGGTAFVR